MRPGARVAAVLRHPRQRCDPSTRSWRSRTRPPILIATDQREALTQLAETMRRGQVEANVDDGQHAAQTELGRAPRITVDPVVKARWDDRQQRPLGRVVNLGKILQEEQATEAALHARATILTDQIASDQTTLETLDERLATWQARAHAATLSGLPALIGVAPTQPARDKLATRLDERRTDRAAVTTEWRKAARRIRQAETEQSTRTNQPAQYAERENQAGLAGIREHARDRRTQPPPP